MSSLKISSICCGVQEFFGIGQSVENVLKFYCETSGANNKNNKNSVNPWDEIGQQTGATCHSYVMFAGTDSQLDGKGLEGLVDFIKKNKLGETTFTGYTENQRYRAKGGSPIGVVIWTPDFEAVDKWYENKYTPKKVVEKVKEVVDKVVAPKPKRVAKVVAPNLKPAKKVLKRIIPKGGVKVK